MKLATILPIIAIIACVSSAAAFVVRPNTTTRSSSGSVSLFETIKEKAQGVADAASKRAKDDADSVKNKAQDTFDSAKEKVEGAPESVKDDIASAKDTAVDKTKDFLDATKEAIEK